MEQIVAFNVANGRGPSRGCILVEVIWQDSDETPYTLVVARSTKHLFQDHSEIEFALSCLEPTTVGIFEDHVGYAKQQENRAISSRIQRKSNLCIIGQCTRGDTFQLADADVPKGGNVFYYAWMEKSKGKGRQILDFKTASISVRRPETQEEFVQRKLRTLKAQQALNDARGHSGSDVPNIEQIVEDVVGEIKKEEEILNRVAEAVAKYDLDERSAEFLETETVRRIFEAKEE
jgi:hypothetical protein